MQDQHNNSHAITPWHTMRLANLSSLAVNNFLIVLAFHSPIRLIKTHQTDDL